MIKHISAHGNTLDMVILEIGSWTGCSMQIFADYFKTVICVDPFSQAKLENGLMNYDVETVENLFNERKSKYNNIIHIKETSQNAKDLLPQVMKKNKIKQIDIVYIDGAHDYIGVLSDIVNYKPIAKKFLCGHDYSSKFPGVITACKAMDRKPDKLFLDTSFLYKAGK
jgi:cephalosporin hydroxylase